MAALFLGAFLDKPCTEWQDSNEKYCKTQHRILDFSDKPLDKCNAAMYDTCCEWSDKFCEFYHTQWFLFCCIGGGILLVILIIIIIACCCCKGRGGGGKDPEISGEEA